MKTAKELVGSIGEPHDWALNPLGRAEELVEAVREELRQELEQEPHEHGEGLAANIVRSFGKDKP